MIDMNTLAKRIVAGLKEFLGVQHVIEADQPGKKPRYPFVAFKWISVTPEEGNLRKTKSAVPSADPRWDKDVEYRYVSNPVLVLSLTVFDSADSINIHQLCQRAHSWFTIPELGPDYLRPLEVVVLGTTPITARDTVLAEEIERRQGFDVRLQVVDVVEVVVPTIERVVINGKTVDLEKE